MNYVVDTSVGAICETRDDLYREIERVVSEWMGDISYGYVGVHAYCILGDSNYQIEIWHERPQGGHDEVMIECKFPMTTYEKNVATTTLRKGVLVNGLLTDDFIDGATHRFYVKTGEFQEYDVEVYGMMNETDACLTAIRMGCKYENL